MELQVLEVRERANPHYRVVEYKPIDPGYWEALNAALPQLKFPHHAGAFPPGWLIIDQHENVVVGWCSTLDSFERVSTRCDAENADGARCVLVEKHPYEHLFLGEEAAQ